MSEDDPLFIERQNMVKAKQDMEAYVQRRRESKVKPTAMEESIKQGLQKALQA